MIKRTLLLLGIIIFAFCYAPPPEYVSAQFGTQSLSTSTGSVNAQSVPFPNYRLNVGVPITFVVGTGLNNTDATTLNVNATGAKAFNRVTQVGVFSMVGGELVDGAIVTAMYDGASYRQIGIIYQVGVPVNFRGNVSPGYQIEDGTCLNAATARNAALFAYFSTTYGSCGAGTFKAPDTRGRTDTGLDNQGANGAAGIITNCSFTFFGNICGNQNSAMTSTSQFPPYTPGGGISGSVGAPTISFNGIASQVLNQVSGGNANVTGGGGTYFIGAITATASTPSFSGSFAGTPVGASAAIPTLSPVFGTVRAIKL